MIFFHKDIKTNRTVFYSRVEWVILHCYFQYQHKWTGCLGLERSKHDKGSNLPQIWAKYTPPYLNFQWWIDPSSIYVAKQQRTKWRHLKFSFLSFQWLCLILYLYTVNSFWDLANNDPYHTNSLYFSSCS